MPRYTLRVPHAGDFLYGDDGDTAVVADTIDDARKFFLDERDERDEPAIYLHSYIGSCQLLYKHDVENGDGHEDAEPGDTTVWYLADTGRELKSHECRVWMLGAPPWPWRMEPVDPAPVPWREVPVGTRVSHAVWGWGEVCLSPRAAPGRHPVFPIRFEDGRRADLLLGQISLYFGGPLPLPPRRFRVTVRDELVVDGASERTARHLLDLRIARLNAEWEAEQFATYEATRPAVVA